jgi:hypothetical protein
LLPHASGADDAFQAHALDLGLSRLISGTGDQIGAVDLGLARRFLFRSHAARLLVSDDKEQLSPSSARNRAGHFTGSIGDYFSRELLHSA